MSPNDNDEFETRGYAVAHSVISYETAEACRVDAIAALNAALSACTTEKICYVNSMAVCATKCG